MDHKPKAVSRKLSAVQPHRLDIPTQPAYICRASAHEPAARNYAGSLEPNALLRFYSVSTTLVTTDGPEY